MCQSDSCGSNQADRREFLRLSAVAVAGMSLDIGLEPTLGQTPSVARMASDDPTIKHGQVSIREGANALMGQLARPMAEGKYPGIVVIPGNWLVEPYIPEFVAQLAQAGFAALAVDAYPMFPKVKNWEEAEKVSRDITQKLIREKWTETGMLGDVRHAADYLSRQPFVSAGKIGITGFCGGAWNAILAAVDLPDLIAGVVAFYAPPDAAKENNRPRSVLDVVGKLTIPLQAHYGTKDRNFPMSDIERVRKEVTKLTIPAEVYLYDAEHGFMAYNRVPEFNSEAAQSAFDRMRAFFRKYVR